MGTQSSKEGYLGNGIFSSSENKNLETVFIQIAGEGKRTFDVKQLQDFLRSTLLAEFSTPLHLYMTNVTYVGTSKVSKRDSSNGVDDVRFVTTMVHALKGSADQLASLVTCLGGSLSCIILRDLWKLFTQLVRTCLSSLASTSHSVWRDASEQNTNAFVRHLLHDLVYKGDRSQCDVSEPIPMTNEYTNAEIEVWLSRSAFAQDIIRRAFARCFVTEPALLPPSLIPVCQPSRHVRDLVIEESALLNSAAISFLNHYLPHDLRGVLRPVFSSVKQGESFSALLRAITNQGPSIIVVSDSDGHVFGGFASESWTLRPQFYGSSYCFLFTLSPLMDVYHPSGLNTNYMYLNQNQLTLPNGLGMGGQFDYFGFWLDQQYGTGHSKAQPKCTTYKSPQLSAKPQFSIHTIEVWAVGPGIQPATDDAEEQAKTRSILDKADAGTKAILEMAGKGSVSDAIREADM